VNVLIPALTERREILDLGERPPEFLPPGAIVPAERARPGTVGLLLYDPWVWRGFVESAASVEKRPRDAAVGLAAIEYDERSLVVPDPAIDEPVAAFWRVDKHETLGVSVAHTHDLPEIAAVPGALARLTEPAEPRLRNAGTRIACANRKSTLACEERDCERGRCVVYSWLDPDYHVPVYGCVCTT
jgi:hypothetical protein